MDSLVNPTVMFFVEVMKGNVKVRVLRLTELVGEENGESSLFEGDIQGCSGGCVGARSRP